MNQKYIRVRHWNYWWGAYQLLEEDQPDAAEFSLTHDEDGTEIFFHFDFLNLPALRTTIEEQDFIESSSPEYPVFLEKVEALRRGEIDHFVGVLYYPHFHPNVDFCNPKSAEGKTIFDAQRPMAKPEYGVVFLREQQPLVPDVLKEWVEKLSQPLFGETFTCEFSDVPTKKQAQDSYRDEFAHLTFGHGLRAK